MKIAEFDVLPKDQKMRILWSDGNYIADRKVHYYSIVLYHLFSFYVEVWYASDLNEIDILAAFDDAGHLEPYLDMIDIDSVIS
jgi:hypothetical protein